LLFLRRGFATNTFDNELSLQFVLGDKTLSLSFAIVVKTPRRMFLPANAPGPW
jgi:hypothetical protein